MADIIRASSLMGVRDLIVELGGDPDALFQESGIVPSMIGNYDAFLPYTRLAALIGAAAAQLDRPDFGLLLSEHQDVEMFGPVAVLIRYSRTVEDALRGLIRYLHTYSSAVEAGLRVGSAESAFTYSMTVRRLPHPGQIAELTMGVVLDMFRLVTDRDFTPNRIQFCHKQISRLAAYEDHFGCSVEFDAVSNALVFPTGYLSRVLDTGDDQAYALAERYLGSQQQYVDLSANVSAVIEKFLPLGQADLANVARSLLLHPRVLQRRLEAVNTNFDQLLDDVRRASATKLLIDTDLPLSMIAQQLGYSEQSSLSRSCRRWFGASATKVRRG